MKKIFNKIIELTDAINENDLVYYFKVNSTAKKCDKISNGITFFKK